MPMLPLTLYMFLELLGSQLPHFSWDNESTDLTGTL